MKYFSNFGSLNYSLDDNDLEFKLIKNPLTRVRVVKDVLENIQIFYQYQMKDSDNPEVIAHKLYNDPNRYWMVMFANNLIDPYYDVPLDYSELDSYVEYTYGSVANAQSEIHHYERRTEMVTNDNGMIDTKEYVQELQEKSYNYSTGVVVNNTLPTLATSPITVETTTDTIDGVIITKTVRDYAISSYDYELTKNEDKRTVNLIRNEFVQQIENEFKQLLSK